MGTAFIVAILLLGAYLYGQKSAKQQVKDFDTVFKSRFVGIFPVWADGPNDTTVEQRAEEWRTEFKKYGNSRATVVAYPYNRVLNSDQVLTTITSDYTNTMVAYCRHYLEITGQLHAQANAADAAAAARHLSGQGFNF